jgi:adhesin/invasin
MMLQMKNKDASIPSPAACCSLSGFFRILLLGTLLFLLGFSGNAKAPPERKWVPYQVTVTMVQNNSLADGMTNDIVRVTVMDMAGVPPGLPVPAGNVAVSFNISGTTVSTNVLTNASGIAEFGQASTSLQPATINITVPGSINPTPPVIFTYIAQPPSGNPPGNPPGGTYYIVTTDNQTANGATPDVVKVHLSDINGNNAGAGHDVVFTITGGTASGTAKFAGNGSTTTVTGTTDANGDIVIPVVSTKSGDVQITATLNGIPIVNSPRTVNFVPDVPNANPPGNPAGGTYYIVTTDNQKADGVTPDVVKVHLSDINGNNVGAGHEVVFTITGGTAFGTAKFAVNGSATTITGTTDANGDILIPIVSTKISDVQITATLNGVPIVNSPRTVHFVSDVPNANPPGNPPGGTYYIVTTDNQSADGSTPDVVKVHLSDINGNNVGAGHDVVFTITGGITFGTAKFQGNGSTTTITGTTDANGDILIPIVSSKTGDAQITATLNGIPLFNSPRTVHFVSSAPSTNPPGNPPGGTYYIVTADNQTADGAKQDVVKVHLSDATGNNVGAGFDVVFTINGGIAAGTAKFQGNGSSLTFTGTTDANGDILVPLVSTKAGDVQIAATYNGTPIANSPRTINFVIGAPHANPPGNPAGGTSYVVTVDNQTADNVAQDFVKVHLSDITGNNVGAGHDVVFTITGGVAAGIAKFNDNGSTTTITGTTDANGDILIPIVSTKAGDLQITAKLDGVPIVNSPRTVHFVAGPGVPSAPGVPPASGGGPGGTLLTISFNNVPANGIKADSADAFITDQYGNPVAGIAVTFTFHTGGPANSGALFQPGNVTTITVVTRPDGHIAVPITNTVPGDAWIDASINSGALIDGSYAVAHFSEAPDLNNPETQLIVIVYEALADGTSTTVVKAHVVDKSGNPIADQDVLFAVDSGFAQILTPEPHTTDANGDVFISLISKTPGYVLITATIDGQPIIFGSPARVKFAPINIYVPRVFTPNNDGTNDLLKPFLVGISAFHYFSIYNRWGNLIYTTQDPNRGWDGTFKGVAQPVETYLWIAEGIDVNGKKIVAKGMTSLVR